MKTNPLLFLLSLILLITASCDGETMTMGGTLMPQQDLTSTTQKQFLATSISVKSEAVTATSNSSYLGSMIDPETHTRTTASFLAQFHLQEDYRLPTKKQMVTDKQGAIVADSCILRMYYDKYLGDSLAVMKVKVQELNKKKVLEENQIYYTNIDPQLFLAPNSSYTTSVSYSPLDQTKSNSSTHSKTHYRSVNIPMPTQLGTEILQKYYASSEYFRNSHQFIRNVCAGFFFEHDGGEGAMLQVDFLTLDLYFRYHTKTPEGKDTIVVGQQRLGATKEVIQCTKFDNNIPDALLSPDTDFTYLKSPAGIYTEVALPIADIINGEHYNDTINSAQITFQTYNESTDIENHLHLIPRPNHVLLVRKSEAQDFFKRRKLPNNISSYLAAYSHQLGVNAYIFENISALITSLRTERDKLSGVNKTDTQVQRVEKWKKWEAIHPDWNKVLLIPVRASYTVIPAPRIDLPPVNVLRNVEQEFGLSSVKLVGNSRHKIPISVIYSKMQ